MLSLTGPTVILKIQNSLPWTETWPSVWVGTKIIPNYLFKNENPFYTQNSKFLMTFLVISLLKRTLSGCSDIVT